MTAVSGAGASVEGLTYHVEMTLPPAASEVRDALHDALHRSDRRIGVITGGRERGVYLGILTAGESDAAARNHARRLVTAALENLGLAELAPQIRVGEVTARPALAGGAHLVDSPPPLAYRTSMLADGRVLKAACLGPLGEWFAFLEGGTSKVVAGRSLPEVLDELFELPWGKKESWVYDAIAELAGHPTRHGVRFACPCCDRLTLVEPPPGTHAICEVCRWVDDRVQFRDPDYRGGANRVSLREARDNFARYGRSDAGRGGPVRAARPDEQPPSG